MDCVSDRIPTLQRDYGQCEDGQFAGKHRNESGDFATNAFELLIKKQTKALILVKW
jgi:hypothetical protein